MSRFRVGLMDPVMAARPTVDAFSRANYLAAVANRVDSYWVPDHINGQTPRPLWDPKYTAAARILRSPDAAMDAWTLLGSLAARRRFNRPCGEFLRAAGYSGVPFFVAAIAKHQRTARDANGMSKFRLKSRCVGKPSVGPDAHSAPRASADHEGVVAVFGNLPPEIFVVAERLYRVPNFLVVSVVRRSLGVDLD